jgi:hypothetical protein
MGGACVIGYNATNGKFLWKVLNVVEDFSTLFMSVNEILHEVNRNVRRK